MARAHWCFAHHRLGAGAVRGSVRMGVKRLREAHSVAQQGRGGGVRRPLSPRPDARCGQARNRGSRRQAAGLVSTATRRPLPRTCGGVSTHHTVTGFLQVVLRSAHEDAKHDGRGPSLANRPTDHPRLTLVTILLLDTHANARASVHDTAQPSSVATLASSLITRSSQTLAAARPLRTRVPPDVRGLLGVAMARWDWLQAPSV